MLTSVRETGRKWLVTLQPRAAGTARVEVQEVRANCTASQHTVPTCLVAPGRTRLAVVTRYPTRSIAPHRCSSCSSSSSSTSSCCSCICSKDRFFTHPLPLGGADAYMFYRCFFCFFSVFLSVFFRPPQNMSQPFSGTAERIFMKLLQMTAGKMEFPSPYPNGGYRTPINFFGAKNYTVRAWC